MGLGILQPAEHGRRRCRTYSRRRNDPSLGSRTLMLCYHLMKPSNEAIADFDKIVRMLRYDCTLISGIPPTPAPTPVVSLFDEFVLSTALRAEAPVANHFFDASCPDPPVEKASFE